MRTKLNIVGIIGGIIAFVSLFFPWWTMTLSETVSLTSVSETISIYPYRIATIVQLTSGSFATTQVDIWYGWVALVLVVIGGLLGLAGSIKQKTKGPVMAGGILTLLAVIIFVVGLQNDLSNSAVLSRWPAISLFGSGTFGILNYSAYLDFGLWLALAAAIIMLAASLMKREATVAQPTPTSASQTATPITGNEPT
jgi:hypothetical protein